MKQKIKNVCFESGRNFTFNKESVSKLSGELESFIQNNMYDLDFSDFLYVQEIKANNTIEGYIDDIDLIGNVIDNSSNIKDLNRRNRIINLYKGYKYILEKKNMDKENLKELYSILSKGLLDQYDIDNMGDYYRNDDVYIFYSPIVTIKPDMGVKSENIESLMNNYFEFLEDKNNLNNMTDYYIKSQIAHLYFVYIHPYFDINGRTSRTASMWYLLNNNCDPYVIFNRAIENNRSAYYRIIREAKEYGNVTGFVKYMMINTKIELEKEYVFRNIKNNTNENLTLTDYNTIMNILSMRGLKTLKDFTSIYNRKNEKKKPVAVYDEMLLPLLEKNIIIKKRETNNFFSVLDKNFVFEFNKKYLDLDKSKIKRIKL